MRVARVPTGIPALVLGRQAGGGAQQRRAGVQDAAWAPDGKRIALSYLDRDSAARVEIEDRFPKPLLDTLQSRGHLFQKIGRKGEVRYGYTAAVTVDVERVTVEGGAEPRRSHAAVAAARQLNPKVTEDIQWQ